VSKCVMLLRHAEKPNERRSGVNEAGKPDEGTLSVAGWLRAGALVPYFASLADRLHSRLVCRPQHIFAARSTAQHPSTRPRDTVRPLADMLGIPVDERWSDEDPVELVGEALRSIEEPVLVCWRHDHLPALARSILQSDGIPEHWPGNRFDITWSIRPENGGWILLQVPQLLLAGDQVDVIGLA
jgi:broad specificity phosphatase PhoE